MVRGTRGWKTTILKHVAFMSAVSLPFRTQQLSQSFGKFMISWLASLSREGREGREGNVLRSNT